MATTYSTDANPNANHYESLPASASSPTPGYVPAGTPGASNGTSVPSVLSSKAGADIVSTKTKTLNQLSPAPVTTTTPAASSTTAAAPAASSTKVTLINPNTDQTVMYEDAAINKDNIQSYLNSGYVLSEASGAIPSWLQPTGTSAPQTEEQKLKADIAQAESEVQNLNTNLSKFTVSDADLARQVQGITAQWNSRIADMQRVNTQRVGSINTLGVRLGSRFAGGSGGSFGGIISEEERQGVQRVADLEGEKQAAIAAAKTAAMTQNWKVYAQQVDNAQRVYEKKVSALQDLQKATAEQNKLIADAVKAERDAQRLEEKDYYDRVTKPLNDLMLSASKGGAPQDVIDAINNSASLADAVKMAGSYLQDVPTSGIVGEYLFYKKQAEAAGQVAMDFDSYQNVDANRKRSIAAAGAANDFGLNPKQVAIFIGLVDKQNKSPLIAANDRAVILKDVTSELSKDPTNAALQVSFIYSMIQALDTYQSAVREGEIGLLSSTQGLGDKLQNLPQKIQSGTPLSKNKINEYIAVSKTLTNSISDAADATRKSFSAQAKIAGVGDAFTEYQDAVYGLNPVKDSLNAEAEAQSAVDAAVVGNPDLQKKVYVLLSQPDPTLGRALTYSEVLQYLEATK